MANQPDPLATVRAALDLDAAYTPDAVAALHNAAPAIADLCREVEALRAAAEEREGDMHMRIRAGYDKTIADAWRAEVSKRDERIATLEAELAQVRSKLKEAADLFIAIQATDGEEEHRAICDGAALAAKIDAATGAKE